MRGVVTWISNIIMNWLDRKGCSVFGAAFFLALSPVGAMVQAAANEVVPHAARSVVAHSGGFLELVGPGQWLVNGKVAHYRKGKYIRSANIHSLSEVEEVADGCILHYASYDYSENITVRQPCKQVLEVMHQADTSAGKGGVASFKIK